MAHRAGAFVDRQTMLSDRYEIFHYKDGRAANLAVHHHDFYELYLYLKGSVRYWIEGQILSPETGQMLLIPPGVLHHPVVDGSTAYERIVLWIDAGYMESLDTDGALRAALGQGEAKLLSLGELDCATLFDKFSALLREMQSREPGADLCADGLFLQSLVQICRLCRCSETADKPTPPTLTEQVIAFIGEHFAEPLTLSGLGEQFYVSKYHLSHQFSQDTGISLYRFIRLKRLQAARSLLLSGVTPATAASESGFTDYSTFFRAYKAEYGVSPNKI